ncbi:MAG: hypothetical protein U0640_11685 [Phycisphaerales bacterium]
MGKLSKRVERIESQRKGKVDPNWHIVDECGHALHVDKVRANPDMRLVELCDTDVMTYARIQVDIAYADRNEVLLNKWFAKSRKPRPPQKPGESDWDYVRRYAWCNPAEIEAEEQRERDAIERARARIGKASTTKTAKSLDDFMQQDDECPWERSYGTKPSSSQR